MMSNDRFNISLPAVLLLGMAVYALFSVSLGHPIFCSDEYAYYISGKFNDQLPALYQLDPGLQRISNLLYFAIIQVFSRVFGTQFILGFRLVHSIEYLFAAWLIYQTVVRSIGTRNAMLGTAAFLLMPAHIYIYTVMPETELVLLVAILSFILVRVYPHKGSLGSLLAGALIGVGVLIKPHALAMLLAVLGAMVVLCFLCRDRRRIIEVLTHNLLLLASCYITIVVLWCLTSKQWILDPSAALGLQFYGRYLENAANHISFLSKLGSTLLYMLGHLVVIALIFAPVLVWSLSHVIQKERERQVPCDTVDLEKTALAVFTITMIASHIAMTSWFTAGAGALSEGEAMRLHGRYLGPALAFFPVLYFFAIGELSAFGKKLISVISGLAMCLYLGVVIKTFKIFPWDYPLLFAFFNEMNWYHWAFEGNISHLGSMLFLVVAIGLVLSVCYRGLQVRILYLQLFLILLVGCLQTYGWIFSSFRNHAELSMKSKAISTILGTGQFGKGVVIAEERYGRESYILFGLANAPKVIERKVGSVISEADIAGADWLILGNEYLMQFDHRDSISLGPLKFFPIKPAMIDVMSVAPTLLDRVSTIATQKVTIAPDVAMQLVFGEATTTGVHLDGFNPPEDWGAWSAKPSAQIEMPLQLQGHIKLKMFAWTLNENLAAPIRLRIGNVTVPLSLSDVGKEIQIDLVIAQPSDHIVIESSIFKPNNSHRYLGVAIARMTIERMPK